MRISARCDYACKALLELSLHWPDKDPLPIHVISKKQKIPTKYLIQILIQLKRIGLVNSIRGKDGGYVLARQPRRIALHEVIKNLVGPLLPLADSAREVQSVFTEIWKEIEGAIYAILRKVSFEDIVNKNKTNIKVINYQI